MARLVVRPFPLLWLRHHPRSIDMALATLNNNNNLLPLSPSHSLSFTTTSASINTTMPSASITTTQLNNRTLGSLRPSGPRGGEGGSDSESDNSEKKSRNQKKREARRAVSWGMQLAAFSPPQIKRILKVASLEREVFEALMLVKRLRPDVREGKRRQYNYIGKLLRDVEPELMDAVILATKDGDWSRLQGFTSFQTSIIDDSSESTETEYEDEDEELTEERIKVADRWFDGLVNKNVEVTNKIYALQTVDFDRQELRKLVRRVHAVQEAEDSTEENEQEAEASIKAGKSKKALSRFLKALAKQMPSESYACNKVP